MNRLRFSLAAFGGSLLVLYISARQALIDGIGDAARGIAGAIDLLFSLLGGQTSITQTSPDDRWSVVAFIFVFITIACFWWVVRELVLRYGKQVV